MDRRRFVKLIGASTPLMAGCLAGAPTNTLTGSPVDGAVDPSALANAELPVPRSEMLLAIHPDAIAAITEPDFAADWSDLSLDGEESLELDTTEPVIGVERGGTARAYPLRVLRKHEVVNDVFGGPLLVTYCPLCGSSMVAQRTLAGEATQFGVSGYLWRGDLVMYDRATRTLWSQLLAQGINGPHVAERLRLVPSALTSLSEWRREHPETEVLLPPPLSGLIHGASAELDDYVAGYDAERSSVIGSRAGNESGVSRGTLVVGVKHEGVARAYPFPAVREADVVNDSVAGLSVVVTTTPAGSLAAYRRTIDGRTVEFAGSGERYIRGDGSRWERATGRAVDDPHEGRRLPTANAQPPMFWTGWSSFHPETTVYGTE